VTGHAVLLASALRNLIGNALKFTGEGQPVRVTVRAANAASLVSVEDGGAGVRAEDREAIFDPFYRSPEARATQAGFGLGLPILRRVARAHGGDVTLSTSSLGGAWLELRVPAWRPSA
jgi:prevent-host-death family protein